MRALRAALACVLATFALPPLCRAQEPQRPGWVADFTVLSGNVLVSAVSAGAVQKARGGSFRDGFARGAAGGAGVFAGKRIAAARWAGAGLVGRQVASAARRWCGTRGTDGARWSRWRCRWGPCASTCARSGAGRACGQG
jgi:hypothetical protein